MARKRISHLTAYHYNQPVRFGPHRVMMRPREGHDVRIVNTRVELEPAATVRWLRDIEDNCVAILTFSGPRTTLLEGAAHLAIFVMYIVLMFSP